MDLHFQSPASLSLRLISLKISRFVTGELSCHLLMQPGTSSPRPDERIMNAWPNIDTMLSTVTWSKHASGIESTKSEDWRVGSTVSQYGDPIFPYHGDPSPSLLPELGAASLLPVSTWGEGSDLESLTCCPGRLCSPVSRSTQHMDQCCRLDLHCDHVNTANTDPMGTCATCLLISPAHNGETDFESTVFYFFLFLFPWKSPPDVFIVSRHQHLSSLLIHLTINCDKTKSPAN